MAAMDQRADVAWRDGVIPVSTRFDDPYFSLNNGLAETRHVFLAGNQLPDRLRDGFHVAELLKERTDLPVRMWDERSTTVTAHNILNETNVRGKARKAVVDTVAATIILEGYLEYRRKKAKQAD
jgi:hypothetical protein